MSIRFLTIIVAALFVFTACQAQNQAGVNVGEEAVPDSAATVTQVPTQPPTATTPATNTPSPPSPTPEPPATEPPPATPGSLSYTAYVGGQPAATWDLANYKAYSDTRPGLQTDYQSGNLYSAPVPDQIYDRLAGEETSDVFSSFIVGEVRTYVDAGLIREISDIWQEQGWHDQYPQSLQDYVTFEGNIYFVPQALQWNPIWYRTDIFAEVGLEPPASWVEFLGACDTLHEAGFIPITVSSTGWTPPLARWFSILNLRLNGPDFHEALLRGDASYEDPRVREVFVHWQEMFAHNCFDENPANYGQAVAQLFNGEAAMYNLGEWLSESTGTGLPDTLDFFSMPVLNPEHPRAEIVHVYGAYIHNNGKNEAEARAYLSYLGSVESQTSNAEALNRLVANTAVDPAIYPAVYQRGLEFVENAEGISQLFELSTHPDIAKAGLKAFADFFEDPSDETIDEILAELEEKRLEVYPQ